MSELILPSALQTTLANELQTLATLEQVLRWGLAQTPQREVLDVVVQDEYTHDVVMSWQPGYHLVFDTT